MYVRCRSAEKKIDKEELMFLLTDDIGIKNNIPNPAPNWFHDKSWNDICRLDKLNTYNGRNIYFNNRF